MEDLFLIFAGAGGILIAFVHGWLGQTLVLRSVDGLSPPLRSVNAAVFQLSTIYWLATGLALLSAPWLWGDEGRHIIVIGAVFVYSTAAVGNAWATKGRHFGWMALTVVCLLALAGL
ncbi:MAG: hypothetical protein AAFQ09_12065 [Pseudomonadota bacterium]